MRLTWVVRLPKHRNNVFWYWCLRLLTRAPYAFKYKLPIIGFPYKLHESQTLLRVIFEQLHFMVEQNKITRNFLSFVPLFPLSSNIRTIGFVSCLNTIVSFLFSRSTFWYSKKERNKKRNHKYKITVRLNTKNRFSCYTRSSWTIQFYLN